MRGVGLGRPTPPVGPERASGTITAPSTSVAPSKVFVECFAGTGVLSDAMAEHGMHIVKDEVEFGGTDFADPDQVLALKDKIFGWKASGADVMLHLAPLALPFRGQGTDRARHA